MEYQKLLVYKIYLLLDAKKRVEPKGARCLIIQ